MADGTVTYHGEEDMQLEKRLVNLTPHDVAIIGSGAVIVVPPSGRVARIEDRRISDTTIQTSDGPVTVTDVRYGDVVFIPPPDGESIFIVSQIVAMMLAVRGIQRDDVVSPGRAVKDGSKAILGCVGLWRVVR
jgi:hypothetical protein